MNFIRQAFKETQETLQKFIENSQNELNIEKAIALFVACFKNEGKIFSCGNGGSMCDSLHFAEELTGRFRQDRPALPALALADPAHISCVSNDFGYEHIFSRSIASLGKKEDCLLVISTSGNSQNVILACEEAKKKNMKVVGLLGKAGGKLKNMVDVAIIIPSESTEKIQEMHIQIIHIFIQGIERGIFPQLY